jgi:two-component system CheB/CheR fusion protein
VTTQTDSPISGASARSHQDPGWPTTIQSVQFDPVEILDTIDVPIIVLHRDCTIASFNRAAADAFGLIHSDVHRAAREIVGFVSLRDLDRWCEQVILARLPSRHDFRYKDRTFVMRIAPFAKHNSGISGSVLTFMNVTAFRASLDAAIYEREYTKAILNTGTDPLVVLGQDLRLHTANRAFYEMFGISRESLPSISLDTLENGAFDLPRLHIQLQQMLDKGYEFEPLEVEHDFARTGLRTLILIARPFSLPGDSQRHMILLSFRDITQRKRAEEALQAAAHAKDEFLAMLGHELRNPLGALASAVRILDLAERSPDHAARARTMIGRQLDQLTHLVDDLLDVCRVTSAKMRLNLQPLELSQTVEETIEGLRTRGVIDRHQLTFSGQQMWIDADQTRIEQIVTNLVGNSLKFTPPGGTITVGVRAVGPHALLEVTDTGVGIPADVLPTVFELFVQGERSLDRSHGGLGIGLTLVRRLVELHGGTVQAASDGPGSGSTFTVHFPSIPAPDAKLDEQVAAIAAVPRPRRVLVVEDNEDAREALTILLTNDGHEVQTANDGPGGLRAALDFRPDIGLLDLGLPGFDGYALARKIRACDEGKRIYLVALTGYGQSEDRLRSEEAGFDDHLVKPIDVNQLALLLQRTAR